MHKHSALYTSFAFAAALGFAAPVQATIDGIPADDAVFGCEPLGDTSVLVTISASDPSDAAVVFSNDSEMGDGETVRVPMRQIISGSGIRYAGLGVVFHSKAGEGFLDTQTGTIPCTDMSTQTDEAAEEAALNIGARSYGGKLRAGPGMEFMQVGSLAEGDRVTLLVNTQERMNGYDWFFIRLPNGEEAYQWGGLLCSDELHVAGLYGFNGCD